MSRARPPAPVFARRAGIACLVVLAAACSGGKLDAGRNNPRDACAAADVTPSCAPPGLLDGLVGHWRLDDGTGSTTALDSSRQGNNGVVHGLDANTAWVLGRSQGALQTAHSGWVQVAPSASIDAIVDRLTVSAWVDLEGMITAPGLFGTALSRQIGTSEDQYYHLSLLLGQPTLFITTDVGYVMPGAKEAVARDTWIHLAGTYDGSIARVYVNGAEVDSAPLTGSFVHDTTPVILGGNGNNDSGVPTELFPGRIDELMLFSRALSAEEIGLLAAGAAFPSAAPDAGTD